MSSSLIYIFQVIDLVLSKNIILKALLGNVTDKLEKVKNSNVHKNKLSVMYPMLCKISKDKYRGQV